MRLAFILSLIGLAACAGSIQEGAMADCQAYGFTPGTDAYRSCVMQVTEGRRAGLGAYMNSLSNPSWGPQAPTAY